MSIQFCPKKFKKKIYLLTLRGESHFFFFVDKLFHKDQFKKVFKFYTPHKFIAVLEFFIEIRNILNIHICQ